MAHFILLLDKLENSQLFIVVLLVFLLVFSFLVAITAIFLKAIAAKTNFNIFGVKINDKD